MTVRGYVGVGLMVDVRSWYGFEVNVWVWLKARVWVGVTVQV